jgi:hypothetical protein
MGHPDLTLVDYRLTIRAIGEPLRVSKTMANITNSQGEGSNKYKNLC